ncbi:hypothetical protein N836_18825 [Leptolyngbya sp. Heron Island J]|nr:hypothetical protein N836_18825 [Leptolyngbya sp. Heron Island J]
MKAMSQKSRFLCKISILQIELEANFRIYKIANKYRQLAITLD